VVRYQGRRNGHHQHLRLCTPDNLPPASGGDPDEPASGIAHEPRALKQSATSLNAPVDFGQHSGAGGVAAQVVVLFSDAVVVR
jgi:hypothetical protein